MIKDLGNINLEAHVKNDEFESLVNHIIQINGRIQNSVWEGGLLRSIHKYKALRSCLRSPNEEGILESYGKVTLMIVQELIQNLLRNSSQSM